LILEEAEAQVYYAMLAAEEARLVDVIADYEASQKLEPMTDI